MDSREQDKMLSRLKKFLFMDNREQDKKLCSFKRFLVMVSAALVGSILGGYRVYHDSGGSVKRGVLLGGIGFVFGMIVIILVVRHANKRD